jgi:hypothetical protein
LHRRGLVELPTGQTNQNDICKSRNAKHSDKSDKSPVSRPFVTFINTFSSFQNAKTADPRPTDQAHDNQSSIAYFHGIPAQK